MEDAAPTRAATKLDYARLAADLRRAAYPRRVIRQAIGRMMEDDMNRMIVEQLGPERARVYFTRGERVLDATERARLVSRRWEINEQRRQVLGDDILDLDAPRTFRAWERSLGSAMAWDKYVELLRLQEDYHVIHESIHATVTSPAEAKQLHEYAEREARADVESLLTPAELEEWDLRNSGAAAKVKSRLAGRTATEEEFRRLFREQRALDQQNGTYPN
jgi:hypothetical protein